MSASRSVATIIGHGERPAVPQRIGKYRVLFELGRGGMAIVYLAVTQGAGGVSKLVVLKALLPQYATEAEARAMFMDEARLAAQLNHGNVVQTYEVGEEGDHQVIVMEYLEGQSLASVLKRAQKREQSLPLGLHLRVLMHVLDGLHYTHELSGYDGRPLLPVHRDVSPQNVFITYDGRAKVLDFGIAKAASSTTHTATGLIKGKIAYMSPEQMAGETVDRRTDVYAIGCMLWAAAAGRKLWNDISDVNIMHDVVSEAIPTPRSVNPGCDPELERIVMKALAKAGSRYATALELHDDLERFCDARGIADRPRDLARFVAELFEEERAELKGRIERELSQVASGVGHAAPEPAVEAAPTSVDHRHLTSPSRTMSASTLNALPPKSLGKWLRWSWLAAGGAAVAFVVYLALPREPQRVAAASANNEPAASDTAHSKPQSIKVELRSKPPSAQLFLDDQPMQGNPALQVLPQDGAVHRLRAELAGHRTASAEFLATGDQELELKLEETPIEQKSSRGGAAPRPAQKQGTPKAAAPRTAKSTNCAQPFYVGADGIRKIKPSCL